MVKIVIANFASFSFLVRVRSILYFLTIKFTQMKKVVFIGLISCSALLLGWASNQCCSNGETCDTETCCPGNTDCCVKSNDAMFLE